MSYQESSNRSKISRPLLHHQGSRRDGTLGEDGSSSKPPDLVAKYPEPILCINRVETNEKDLKKQLADGEKRKSFIQTRWLFVFLGMIAMVSIGW
jgi:hypothetical protein